MTKDKICGIYCIECKIDNKKYIGLSRDIVRRWKKHKQELRRNRHINKHLQNAWNKYGECNFDFYVLEECSSDILGEREIYYIKKYNTLDKNIGYNLTSGGDGASDVPMEHKMLSIIKQSTPIVKISIDGQYLCEYLNCRIAAEDIGGHTESIRECCNKSYGYKTHKGYIWMYKEDYENNGVCLEDYAYKTNAKSVIQYDLQMNYVAEYMSAKDAEMATGICRKLISKVCRGDRKHTFGYIFKFKN